MTDSIKIVSGGFAGSGKGTFSALFAAAVSAEFRVDCKHLCQGDVNRATAERVGIDFETGWNDYVLAHPEIDRQIDCSILDLLSGSQSFVLDSRLGPFFAQDRRDVFAIKLYSPLWLRSYRIAGRQKKGFYQTLLSTFRRDRMDRERFYGLYDVKDFLQSDLFGIHLKNMPWTDMESLVEQAVAALKVWRAQQ